MSRRVLIVPDKFKGTLTARAAAEAIAAGWRRSCPQDQLELLPMSDGGDGFGDVLAAVLGMESHSCATMDSAHRPVAATWEWDPHRRIAVVETARVIGLALLPPGKFHPFDLDTFGLGALLRDAAAAGAAECWIGIGGSSTNDAGVGVARALGWQFFDAEGGLLERWIDMDRLARTEPPATRPMPDALVTVTVDVENPLLGPDGCSRVYGPQKGLLASEAPRAEAALGRLAEVMQRQCGRDLAAVPGAGAAGGLGFGLQAFLNAGMKSGFEIFATASGLDDRMKAADLVVTGEGSLDRQSHMGKGTGRVAARARALGKPCIGLAGVVEKLPGSEVNQTLFTSTHALAPMLTTPESARAHAAHWLEKLAARVASA